jgi:hypothetical protein
MPYAQAGAMAVDPELAGSASGAVVFSQFFWPAALQQLTGLLAEVPGCRWRRCTLPQ